MSEESECHKTPVRDHLLSLPKDLVFQYEKDGAWRFDNKGVNYAVFGV